MGRLVQPQSNSLSDEVRSALLRLAEPIGDALLREAFLDAVAIELGRYRADELGPGLVFRTAKTLQREFLTTPARHHPGAKYYR